MWTPHCGVYSDVLFTLCLTYLKYGKKGDKKVVLDFSTVTVLQFYSYSIVFRVNLIGTIAYHIISNRERVCLA